MFEKRRPFEFDQLIHGGAVGEDFAVARGNEDADVRLRVHFFNLRGVGGVDNGVANGCAQRLDEYGADVAESKSGQGFLCPNRETMIFLWSFMVLPVVDNGLAWC